jgi:hypothetical protein
MPLVTNVLFCGREPARSRGEQGRPAAGELEHESTLVTAIARSRNAADVLYSNGIFIGKRVVGRNAENSNWDHLLFSGRWNISGFVFPEEVLIRISKTSDSLSAQN